MKLFGMVVLSLWISKFQSMRREDFTILLWWITVWHVNHISLSYLFCVLFNIFVSFIFGTSGFRCGVIPRNEWSSGVSYAPLISHFPIIFTDCCENGVKGSLRMALIDKKANNTVIDIPWFIYKYCKGAILMWRT